MSIDQAEPADDEVFAVDVQAVIDAVRSNDIEKLVAIAEKAVAEAPMNPIGYLILAIVADVNEERARAIDMLGKAHDLDSDCREYALALATLHAATGKLADGLYFFKLSESLQRSPDVERMIPSNMLDYVGAMSNIEGSRHYIEAMRAYNVAQYDQCVDQCMRELRHNPMHKHASDLLGRALLKTFRPGRAISAFQTAVHLDPDNAMAYAGLGEALLNMGQYTDAEACFDRALAIGQGNTPVVCRVQLGRARIPGADCRYVAAPASHWRDVMKEDLDMMNGEVPGSQGPGLRMGIVSDHFYSTTMQPYFTYLVEVTKRMGVDVRLYALHKAIDSTTTRLQNAASSWREIADIDQFTLAETIRREQLDIMMDLCFEPETQGMEIFAVGVAPVQVSWFGRPEAGGLPGITHVLSDSWTKPSDEAAMIDGQSIVTPSHGILSRDECFALGDVSPSQVAESGHVVFGMRADAAGITPKDALAVVDVLRAVPGSQLLLGLNFRLDDEMQNRLIQLFALGGVIDRIAFQELPGGHDPQILRTDIVNAFFRDIDIFLVPSSHAQFDDVAEALWMGAPTVVLVGTNRLTRLSASALAQAGKENWIATNEKEFVSIVCGLADDVDGLVSMRKTLRKEVQASKLFATQTVAIDIMNALASLCEKK